MVGCRATWPKRLGVPSIRSTYWVEVYGFSTFSTPPTKCVSVNFSDEGFAVIACGSDDGVVEREPISVEDGGGITSREGDDVGDLKGKLCERGENGENGEWRMENAPPPEAFQLTLMYFCV